MAVRPSVRTFNFPLFCPLSASSNIFLNCLLSLSAKVFIQNNSSFFNLERIKSKFYVYLEKIKICFLNFQRKFLVLYFFIYRMLMKSLTLKGHFIVNLRKAYITENSIVFSYGWVQYLYHQFVFL